MTIKEMAFRSLDVEFRDAQKYNDKLNQEKITFEKTKEKYEFYIFKLLILLNDVFL